MLPTAPIPNRSRRDCSPRPGRSRPSRSPRADRFTRPDRSPRPKLQLQTPTQPSPLNRVRQALNGFRDKYQFIPRDKLDELLTRDIVKDITMQITNLGLGDKSHLSANALIYEEEYTRIHEKYRVILAILIELSWEEHFVKFHTYDSDDSRLPFSLGELMHIDREETICNLFLKRQYEFIPRTIGGEGRHSWPSEYKLPFVGDYTQNEIGDGGFSKVYKVELYPLYDNINWTYIDDGQDHVYALKQLNESDEHAFMLEAFAGRLLQKRRHSNLLPLLAYFKHGSSFNMIFPYADYDLRTYYGKRSPPETAAMRLQFMTRIQKLTSALKVIHMGDLDQTSERLMLCGYHRDLKPQNILIFNGKFMIADFGLTRFRERNPNDQDNSGVDWELGSSTYRAPECDKEGVKVGRAGDVWSLGCILAEVITFVIGGADAVREFMEHRQKGHKGSEGDRMPENRRPRDWFHDGDRVKPQVLDWLQYLIDRTNRDGFVVDFVSLLEGMLQSHPDNRLKIADVESEFEDILRRETSRLNGVSTTTETAMSAVTCVAELGGSTIKKVTTKRKTTESVSAQYGKPLGIQRVTTERETTESVSASVSTSASAWNGDLFGGLRVILPSWSWTKQSVTTSGERDPGTRRRASSNVGIPEPLGSHNRSHSAPGLNFQDKDGQELTYNPLLPASQISASPMIRQASSSSSMYGPTDPRTPSRPRYSQDSLSPESASRPPNPGIAPLLPSAAIFSYTTPSSSRRSSQVHPNPMRKISDAWKALNSLQKFDTMFLIDDSHYIGDRWPAVKRSLARFADLATKYDTDGIDLAFIHSESEYRSVTKDHLDELMAQVEKETLANEQSGSSMAMSLDSHLSDYTQKYKERRKHGLGHKCKYLNLIVLTSGDPGYFDGFEHTVIDYARILDVVGAPKFQLGIQFALIQSKLEDRERFRRLDDQEFDWDMERVRDIVDTTPYNPDTDVNNVEVLVKVLCGAINPRLDNSEPPADSTADSSSPQMGSVSTPVFNSFWYSETSAQTEYSPIAPPAVPSALDQNASESIMHNGTSVNKVGTKRTGPEARSNPMLPKTSTEQVKFRGGGDEEKIGELRPLLPRAKGGKASYSWSSTAFAVASVACVVLCFLVVI